MHQARGGDRAGDYPCFLHAGRFEGTFFLGLLRSPSWGGAVASWSLPSSIRFLHLQDRQAWQDTVSSTVAYHRIPWRGIPDGRALAQVGLGLNPLCKMFTLCR